MMSLPIARSATASPDGRRRALVVGGGIANFTSVAATFTGIVKAMREQVGALLLRSSWAVHVYKSSGSRAIMAMFHVPMAGG